MKIYVKRLVSATVHIEIQNMTFQSTKPHTLIVNTNCNTLTLYQHTHAVMYVKANAFYSRYCVQFLFDTYRTALSSGFLFPYQYCRERYSSPQLGHSITEPLHAYFAKPNHDVSFVVCVVIFTIV